MAGAIRQQIDIPALERYIQSNVPQIKVPIEVKQVRLSKAWGLTVGSVGELSELAISDRLKHSCESSF